MQTEQLFERAAQQFQSKNYEGGLAFISSCIKRQPQNSSLYGNRALCLAQLGDIEGAQQDLERSLELNHLNYVSYFNLFSLQFRAGRGESALGNLCCSLSCLYLLRAKKSRRELDLQISITYADNNFEAYVLKSLMYLEEGRLQHALSYIERALDINPASLISHTLRQVLCQKIDPYFWQQSESQPQGMKQSIRLKSSYRAAEGFEDEVVNKLNEFNQIYEDLISKEGRVAQKLPRNMVLNDKTIHRSYFLTEISGIPQSKISGIDQPKISGVDQSKISQKRQPDALYFDAGRKSHALAAKKQLTFDEYNQEENLLDGREPSMQHILNLKFWSAKQAQKIDENLLEDQYIEKQNQIIDRILAAQAKDTQDQNLLEQWPSADQPQPYPVGQPQWHPIEQPQPHPIEQRPKDQERQSESLNPSKKQTVSNSKVSQYSSASESINLYPIGKKKRIQVTIIGAEIKSPGNHKDFYLTGSYNSRKGQRIRTSIKKIEGNGCKWYTCNPPTPISEAKQTLEVKLYSKQYFSVNDELIGEGEIEVVRSGETKFPIYCKTKSAGFVTVRIDVV